MLNCTCVRTAQRKVAKALDLGLGNVRPRGDGFEIRVVGDPGICEGAAGIGYKRYTDREPDVIILGPPDAKLEDTDRRHWLTSGSIMHVASGLYVSAAYTR